MNAVQKLTVRFVLVFILASSFGSMLFADDDSDGQEFLFMTEEAYLQEKDKWQVSFFSRYMEREISKEGDEIKQKNQWDWVMDIEYGISDCLQVEVEIPFSHVHKRINEDGEISHLGETGLGDIETGIRVLLSEEDEDVWWSHTISAGFELTWPGGRWRKDLGTDRIGWEASLSISKTLEQWAYHLTGGFGIVNDAREQGESSTSDAQEIALGVALVHSPTDKLDIICELISEFERETSNDNESHEMELYIIPGVQYELFEDVSTGIGVPIGLTRDSYDWGIIAKIQYEW